MGYTFKDIFIGLPDGEAEAKNDLFEKLFCDYNNRYRELVTSSEKFLIVGSKGSGKTYLAHYICRQKEKNKHRKIICANDFLVEKISEYKDAYSQKGYMYAFCEWYLYNKLAEYLFDIYPIRAKFILFSPVYKLKRYYDKYNAQEDIYSVVKTTVVHEEYNEKQCDVDDRIDVGPIEKILCGRSLKRGKKASDGKKVTYELQKKEFFDLLQHFSKLVIKAIGCKEELSLFLDDLDELDYKLVADGDNNITINLIKAAKNINNEFREKKKNVKIVLLVRSDIMNKLQFFDMNLGKIKASCGVELYWLTNTEVSPEEHPLMQMVLHKIKASCAELQNYSNKELFGILFPEKIDGKPPLDFLLDHSFGRPRDIITYLNHVIKEYPDAKSFTAVNLKNVRKLYASDSYDEIVNQTYYHKDPEYTSECMKLISSITKTGFSVDQVKALYDANRDLFPNIDNVEEALEYLYSMSVLGNIWDNGRKSSWYYRKDSLDELDLTKRMTIHYALRKKFAL